MMNKKLLTNRQIAVCAVILCSTTAQVSAGEYVPPPAGPYKPEVIVSDTPAFSTENTGKVYKFPSEDLIRNPSPPAPLFETPPTQVKQRPEKQAARRASQSEASPAGTGVESASPSAGYRGQLPVTPPSSSSIYPGNPWSPDAQSAYPQQSAYPAAPQEQVWYPPQYGYGYPQQQNPYGYGYGYQDYYSNSENASNTPFNNMPTPWNMMPMQPFFPGSQR